MIYATQSIVSATATAFPWFALSTNAPSPTTNLSFVKTRTGGGTGDCRARLDLTMEDDPNAAGSIFAIGTFGFAVPTATTAANVHARWGRFVIENVSGNSSSYYFGVLVPGT